MHCEKQPTPQVKVNDFPVRILVAGSRDYADYHFFKEAIHARLKEHEFDKTKILFITGKARTGADDMIIRFAKEFGYEWAEYPADWDNLDVPGAVIRYKNGKPYNVIAGHMRNGVMGKVCTHAVLFWDGISTGTKDMFNRLKKRGIIPYFYLIERTTAPKMA
jgi:hypothetical protein